jgi:hypothetical protein
MEILQKDSVFPVPLNLCKLAILPRDMSLLQKSIYVIPAKAGIQAFQALLGPGFRRRDGIGEFCKSLICEKNNLYLLTAQVSHRPR